MAVLKEVVEVCPHCGYENIYEKLDPEAAGYKAMCKECGAEIMLCSECMYDPKTGTHTSACNWHEENGFGICRRCVTKRKE